MIVSVDLAVLKPLARAFEGGFLLGMQQDEF